MNQYWCIKMSKKAQKESDEPDAKEIEEKYEEHLIELAKEEEKEEEKQKKSKSDIQLKDLPGLGKKSLDILNENNIATIDQLMTTRLVELQAMGIKRSIVKKAREEITKIVPRYKFFKEEIGLEDIPGVGKTTAEMLREKGMNARRLDGGLPEWKLEGLPIEVLNGQ